MILGSVKTIEKTVREQDAGIFTADVITTGNSGQVMYELLGKNRIFNYVPSHYVDRIPSENRDPLLIRVNEAMVFFYNTEVTSRWCANKQCLGINTRKISWACRN